ERNENVGCNRHDHVFAQYLHQYASHAAWLEDHRRVDNVALFASRSKAGSGASGQQGLEGVLATQSRRSRDPRPTNDFLCARSELRLSIPDLTSMARVYMAPQ